MKCRAEKWRVRAFSAWSMYLLSLNGMSLGRGNQQNDDNLFIMFLKNFRKRVNSRDASYGQNNWACGLVSGQIHTISTVSPDRCGLEDECLAITCSLSQQWFSNISSGVRRRIQSTSPAVTHWTQISFNRAGIFIEFH